MREKQSCRHGMVLKLLDLFGIWQTFLQYSYLAASELSNSTTFIPFFQVSESYPGSDIWLVISIIACFGGSVNRP